MLQALIIILRKNREEINAEISIDTGSEQRILGTLYGLSLKDVEWLIKANSSEWSTPFVVEVSP